jgi:hypothetical protein
MRSENSTRITYQASTRKYSLQTGIVLRSYPVQFFSPENLGSVWFGVSEGRGEEGR